MGSQPAFGQASIKGVRVFADETYVVHVARYAAREFGVKVFGITLSKEQLALAKERVKAEGLEDQVDLQLLDYRDLPQDMTTELSAPVAAALPALAAAVRAEAAG